MPRAVLCDLRHGLRCGIRHPREREDVTEEGEGSGTGSPGPHSVPSTLEPKGYIPKAW